MRIIKDYLDDSILKTLVLPRAKSLFNKSDNIKVGTAKFGAMSNGHAREYDQDMSQSQIADQHITP